MSSQCILHPLRPLEKWLLQLIHLSEQVRSIILHIKNILKVERKGYLHDVWGKFDIPHLVWEDQQFKELLLGIFAVTLASRREPKHGHTHRVSLIRRRVIAACAGREYLLRGTELWYGVKLQVWHSKLLLSLFLLWYVSLFVNFDDDGNRWKLITVQSMVKGHRWRFKHGFFQLIG